MENEDEAGKDRDSGPAADSTQFHSQVTLETIPPRGDRLRSDTNHGIGRSIRMRKRSPRGSLASRIALPVLIAVLATCIVATLLVMQWLFVVQTRELRSAAGGSAYALGRLGGVILEKREAFLRKHPDYPTLSRWRTGDHWLFEGGFIDAETWREATGFNLDEIAPVSVLEQAMSKAALSRYAAEASFGQPRLAAVAILNPDGSIMTSNQNPAWALDLASLMAGIADHPRAAPGTGSSFVEYLNDAKPEPLVRGVCKLMSKEHSERLLGTAVVLVGTGIYNLDRRSYILMSGGILLLQLIGVGSVCWLAVRRMSVSMRRLVTDMQAMTEGDYSRRSNLADADEIGLLAMAFNSLAERLRVARANERENSRLENDLAVARNIQNNLLPPQTPRVRGFDIHTAYRPAREIGGDYFDFLPVDNQHIGMVIADASGKSIPAALVISTTRAILRFVAPGLLSAAETLTRVNAILSVDIPRGMFVSAYYLVCDPLKRSLVCASAGHTPLLLARGSGEVEQINPGGIALGFDSGSIFQRSIREQGLSLEPGDRVLLYTDGVVECVNPANEEYSERRLREFLRRNRELSSHDFIGALLVDLDRHRETADMRDDTTILTFKAL